MSNFKGSCIYFEGAISLLSTYYNFLDGEV